MCDLLQMHGMDVNDVWPPLTVWLSYGYSLLPARPMNIKELTKGAYVYVRTYPCVPTINHAVTY